MTVYFINELGGRCCVKIGYTLDDSPKKRLDGLQTGNPSPLSILGEIPGGSYTLERAIHSFFSQYYVRGEWFDIPEEVLEPFLDEWVWPWPDEDDLMEYLTENTVKRQQRQVMIDQYDPDQWRLEKRVYTKRNGIVSTYYNYRNRQSEIKDGKRIIPYRRGGKA